MENENQKSSNYYNHQLSSYLHRTAIQDLTAITIDLFNLRMEIGDSEFAEELDRLSLLAKNGMDSLRCLELFLRDIPNFRNPEVFINHLHRHRVSLNNEENLHSLDFTKEGTLSACRKAVDAIRWFGIWRMEYGADDSEIVLDLEISKDSVKIISKSLKVNAIESHSLLNDFHQYLEKVKLPDTVHWKLA